jgi:MFS family permease
MFDTSKPEDTAEAERHAAVIREEYEVARAFGRVTTEAERSRAFAILFVSMVCMGAGQTVIYTILPPVGRQLGLNPFQMTTIFACSAFIWIFSSAFWGARSDVWGRKPVMLAGLIAFAVSFAAFATTMLLGLNHLLPVAFVFPLMIASRCIYGTFGSGTSAAATAYVADRTTPKERLHGVAIISMAFALGTIFGPLLGLGVAYVGLLSPFYGISALALASFLAIVFFLPERTPPRKPQSAPATLVWYEPRMFPFVAFGLVLSLAGSIPTQTLAFFFQDTLKLDGHQTATASSIGILAQGLATLFAQFVVVRRSGLSSRTLTIAGIAAAVASMVVFDFARHFTDIVLALVLSGLGFGMARPGFTSGASLSVAAHEQGAVAGLIGAAGAAGFIFGPLVGWLYGLSRLAPYAFGAALLLMLLVAQYLSSVLRRAGDIPPEPDDESAGTQVPNG